MCYFREKEEEIENLLEMNKLQIVQSEKALHDFKYQVERNSEKMYDELKKQVRLLCKL